MKRKMENILSPARVRDLLAAASRARILVVGDIMLDQFIWGNVARISPEAPVPVVDFVRESFMPGGAANVARNLTALKVDAELFGVVGRDISAGHLRALLKEQAIGCANVLEIPSRPTSVKTRVVAHKQQIVRIDRETRDGLDRTLSGRLTTGLRSLITRSAAVIIGDYGKGVVTQPLLQEVKQLCRQNGVWLSVDPKPVHQLNLNGLSLVTPNRKEAFELAGLADDTHDPNPSLDPQLVRAAARLLKELNPALLLITLGEQGMLLCERNQPPFHIPTLAKEVFDVSGAGDTVIASFTAAIAAGASPIEAAIISNHAAGIVVGKIGTATVTPDELMASFERRS
jgi:D-beta-D-heptose 7-phosphate kinase/D-beta-D-heptose 1-phosphate adenosyltransferase